MKELHNLNRKQFTVYVIVTLSAAVTLGLSVVSAYAYVIQPILQQALGR